MTSIADVFVEVRPDTDRFGSELKRNTGRVFAASAGHFKGLGLAAGKVFAAGAAGAVAGFGALAGKAIGEASGLAEATSKVENVFGKAAPAALAFARSADAIGLSDREAADAVGNFGNLLTQLHFPTGDAAKMSEGMTRLASDFASFHNADITDVIAAQQSAFRGEYDALQRFVPMIKAATVEQEALRRTGKKSAKDLTDQEKALAVYDLMLRGAGKAQGDFARTSDGLANRQRILSARWADGKAKLGGLLIPAALKFLDVGEALGKRVMPLVERAFAAAGPMIERAGESVAGMLPAFKSFGEFVMTTVAPAVRELVVGVAGKAAKVLPLLGRVFTDDILPALRTYYTFVSKNIIPVVRGLAEFFVGTLVPAVARLAGVIANGLRGALETIGKKIDENRPQLEALFRGFRNLGEFIIKVFVPIATVVLKAFFKNVGFIIGKVIDFIGDLVAAFQGIATAVTGVVTWVRDAWDGLVGFVKGLPGRIASAASGMWTGFKEGFRSVLNTIIGWWNSLEFEVPKIDPPGPGPTFGGFKVGLPNIDTFATGGIVPGRLGAARLAVVHGGEEVLTPAQRSARRGQGPVEVHVHLEGPVYSDKQGIRRLARELGPLIAADLGALAHNLGRT